MFKRLLKKLIIWLERLTYEPLTVDNANSKLIVPVHGVMVNGQQLYRYKNELDIPIKRRIAISGAHKWFGASIQVSEVIDFLQKMLEANNHGDTSRIGMLGYALQDMLLNCTDEEALYRMAATMYFTRDEDHAEYDNDLMLQKVEAFRKLKTRERDFFFNTLLQHMGVSSDTSLRDIQSSLKKSRVKLKAYRQLASERTSAKS